MDSKRVTIILSFVLALSARALSPVDATIQQQFSLSVVGFLIGIFFSLLWGLANERISFFKFYFPSSIIATLCCVVLLSAFLDLSTGISVGLVFNAFLLILGSFLGLMSRKKNAHQ